MATWPAHGVVKLEKPFVDGRGSIKPLVDIMMKSAVMTDSKAGSLRANHYHKTDWHYCYVIFGRIEYFHRPTGSDEDPECLIVEAGAAFVFAGPDLAEIQRQWKLNVADILAEATLAMPDDDWMATGGKEGRHSEQFAYMIADMQHLQRKHPGATW